MAVKKSVPKTKSIPTQEAIVVKKQINKKALIISSILVLLLIIAAAPSYYFYNEYKKAQMQLQNPSETAQKELDILLEEIGKLMILPQNEIPTLATVSDVNKLKNQEFFKNAQNGDKVLIYSEAKKAILYRPSIKRIVEVSPLQLAENVQPTPTSGPQPTQSAPLTVTIYNGTSKSGLTTAIQTEVTSKVQGLIIDAKENAAKTDYKKTLVINVSGKASKSQLQEIAKSLNAEVTNLPSTEKKPNTDILIIVGADKVNNVTPSPTPTVEVTAQPTETPEE